MGKGLYLDFRSEPEITGLGITDWQKGNYGSIKLNKQTQIIKLITFLLLSLSLFLSLQLEIAPGIKTERRFLVTRVVSLGRERKCKRERESGKRKDREATRGASPFYVVNYYFVYINSLIHHPLTHTRLIIEYF